MSAEVSDKRDPLPMKEAARDADRRGSDARGTKNGGLLGTVRRIMRTLWAYRKLFVPLWLAISAVLVALIFLLPREYGKTLTLAVTPTQSELQAQLAQQPADPKQTNSRAVAFLEQASLGSVAVETEYDPATDNEIQVRLESQDRRALPDAAPEVVAVVEESFRKTYEGTLRSAIRSKIAAIEAQAAYQRATLGAIENQIKQTRPAGPEDVERVVKLTVLEGQRQTAIGVLTGLEEQVKDFEENLENLPELAGEPISVRLVRETPLQEDNRRVPAAAFATLLGFLAAAIVVLRLAARRGK